VIVLVLLDRFGFDRDPAAWTRLSGAGLIPAGVVLVARN